jgi:thiol-disulfide isomerase/thioredoxin
MKKGLVVVFLFVATLTSVAQETVSFVAEIANRNGDVIYIRDIRNKPVKEIKLNEKGVFAATFPVEENFYLMFDGVEYAQLFLKNGFDLKLVMNAQNFDASLQFSGKGAEENNYIAQANLLDQKYDYEGLLLLEEADFTKKVDEKINAELSKLNQSKLDAKFIELQKNNVQMGSQGIKQYYAESQKNKRFNNTVAPSFDYLNHAGGKMKLEDLKGKYVYVDVWATWCGPCRAEIPSLKKIEEKYHGKKIAFVSVSVDAEKDFEKWKKFVTDQALGGIQLYADKSWNSDFIKSFEINSIPRFILIDPSGKVVDANAARPSNPKLQEQLDKLLQ